LVVVLAINRRGIPWPAASTILRSALGAGRSYKKGGKRIRDLRYKQDVDSKTFKDVADSQPRMKQLIIMRRDLNLPPGKAIAQGAHASLWALKAVKKADAQSWEMQGCTKIVLGVDGEDALLEIEGALAKAGLNPRLVHDAGHTVLEAGTLTCLGVGPVPASSLDPLTRHLKLY
jgi:PTH2 family peptidyl-tRNA hydrolase